MNRASALLSALALPLCLAACAGSARNYPSLALRDAERITGTAEPAEAEATPAPAPPASAGLKGQIAGLVDSARQAHDEFLASQEGTEQAISAASGAASASESWTQAQVALAGLESARSNAVISLTELDQLYAVERVASPDAPTPSALAIAAARDEVSGWVEAESTVIADLRSRIGD